MSMMKCEVCAVAMNSSAQFTQHMSGKMHSKKLKQKELAANPPPPTPNKAQGRGRGDWNRGRGRPIVGGGGRGGGGGGGGGSLMRGGKNKRGRGGPVNFVRASNPSTQDLHSVGQPGFAFSQQAQAQKPAHQLGQQTAQPGYQHGQTNMVQQANQYGQQGQAGMVYQFGQQAEQSYGSWRAPGVQGTQQQNQVAEGLDPLLLKALTYPSVTNSNTAASTQSGMTSLEQQAYQYGQQGQAESAYPFGQQAEQIYSSWPAVVQGTQLQNQVAEGLDPLLLKALTYPAYTTTAPAASQSGMYGQQGPSELAYQFGQQAEQIYGSWPAGVQGTQQQSQVAEGLDPLVLKALTYPANTPASAQSGMGYGQQPQQQQPKPPFGRGFPTKQHQEKQQQHKQQHSVGNRFPQQQQNNRQTPRGPNPQPPTPGVEKLSNEMMVFGDNMGVVSVNLEGRNLIYCEICSLKLNSPEQADFHYRGQRHLKKARIARLHEIGAVVENTEKPEHGFFFCAFCNITVNSEPQMEIHRAGTKHQKMVNNRKRASGEDMESEPSPKKSTDPTDNIPHVDPSEIIPFDQMFPVSSSPSTAMTTSS
ncbi:serine/threonine-protein kinase Wnk-like isoform X1 [Littorina saxatilis]|uniref:C2H2-type domain-containing protein n=1 Tax=Littorina saxatilis TaxID=31220 RepID=A0AAN9G2T6_9CAEN